MVSTFTPNINLEEPARGDDVGVWDTPVNSNMSVVDLVAAGVAVIPLNNSPIVLSAAQFQCGTIVFNSTLTGSVAITFPTSFKKPYVLRNACTGSSVFTITAGTTAGGAAICLPPFDNIQVNNDGQSLTFVNLDRIGGYWDYGGSSVPNWVSGCTIPPYLNCDGSAFSALTYPALANILGGTTLPDARGRFPVTLNQGTGRITQAGAGIDGNTNRAAGGRDGITLGSSQIPSLVSANATQSINTTLPGAGKLAYTPAGDATAYTAPGNSGAFVAVYSPSGNWAFTNSITTTNLISVLYSNASQAGVGALAPGYVQGIRMIRAG